MESKPQCEVWTFTGLYNVEMGSEGEVDLSNGFCLSKPTPFLLSARSRLDLNDRQFQEVEKISCFLVHREWLPLLRGPERHSKIEHFQNGLMALQILKPLRTFGFIFQESEQEGSRVNSEPTCPRPPMNPGEWARMRTFDAGLISRAPAPIQKIERIMGGTAAEPKNAIHLLQLGLEHSHPLIGGLLCVMGLEALFDSKDRWDFRKKLCACLGSSTLAFPDWNSPRFPPPSFTVDQVALDLYTLRSKIAHGVDLRKAAKDKNAPVDLVKRVSLFPQSRPRPYAALLSEAAVYLLCQVLQKRFGI